jgi:hypothetical protein
MKHIAAVTTLATGAVAAAGLALAPVASADPAPGVYTATIIDSGKSNKVGSVPGWTVDPCGPDCVHVSTASASSGFDLHRDSLGWSGPSSDGSGTWRLEENSMVLTLTDPELVVAIALMR